MRELTQKELATIALYLLGGDKKSFDTEDIAVKAAEIAPGKFSWRKYRDFIDPELVRKSITDAKRLDGYVVGSHKEGWMVTPKGMLFVQDSKLKSWLKPVERKPEREQLLINKEKERLLSSDAYQYYLKNGISGLKDAPKQMIDDFFRVNDYLKGEARIAKITRLENAFMDDKELGEVTKILGKLEKDES